MAAAEDARHPMSGTSGVIEPDANLSSVFGIDTTDDQQGNRTSYSASAVDDRPTSFDLQPPPLASPSSNIEHLSERLFSGDHLKLILRDATLYSRFRSFLSRYRPDAAQKLKRHIETRKAILAIEYANSIATGLTGEVGSAAIVDQTFDQSAGEQINDLVADALPAFITNSLVQVATEVLVKEITGNSLPLLRDLVQGLAEVYCLTDPEREDNPIVYASEEFYACTQYGRDYVLGRNCRFLQGPKTSQATISRISQACKEGREVCETVLNYRRDGSPFLNLLMIAPLFDNRGVARYFIGAQIDVTGLLENGRGIESFARLLKQDVDNARFTQKPSLPDLEPSSRSPQAALAELSELMSETDVDVVTRHARRSGPVSKGRSSSQSSNGSSAQRIGTERRYIGLEEPASDPMWPADHLGSSGRLPGVFQNYLLVRPYPSLRITFTSPTLRIPGLLQSKFMDRIGGPAHVREGILSAFENGVGVTARVEWGSNPPTSSAAHESRQFASGVGRPESTATQRTAAVNGGQAPASPTVTKPRWLHCTPLYGSDGKVGVWMVVMVEREEISGGLNVAEKVANKYYSQAGTNALPRPVDSTGGAQRFNSTKLYKDYLRREGRAVDSIVEATYHPSDRDRSHDPQRPQPDRRQAPSSRAAPGGGSQPGARASAAAAQAGPGPGPGQSAPARQSSYQAHQLQQMERARQPQLSTMSPQERELAAQRARVLAERAMAGEEGFRDF